MKQTLSFLFFTTIVYTGCFTPVEEYTHQLIRIGCVPQKVTLTADTSVLYENTYIYEDKQLTQYGDTELEYENGLVSKAQLGPERYEEYTYNKDYQLAHSIQYRQDDPAEGFKVVFDYAYEYKNGRIVKVVEATKNETYTISYFPGTGNIDSLKRMDSNSALIELTVYQYDQSKNPFTNLLMAHFNHFWWLDKRTENNVIEKKVINFKTQTEIFYEFDIDYNEYHYPSKIINTIHTPTHTSTSEMNIEYIHCK